jgi:heptosyltransferase-3
MVTTANRPGLTGLQKFLLVRTDRMGDVILSMPVATAIKRAVPHAHISLLCRCSTAIIGERNPDVDAIVLSDTAPGEECSFFTVRRELRSGKFDCAVMLHPTFKLALLIKSAGIPLRVGTGFRFYSMLFNKRHYEHRKVSEKHESEYNIHLLRPLGISSSKPVMQFEVNERDEHDAQDLLKEIGLGPEDRYVVIHPGSGGSAMDWPLQNYAEVARMIARNLGLPVVISWGPNERHLADHIRQYGGSRVFVLPRVNPLTVFAAFVRSASLLLAPSTGVLHLAHTVGTPVLGLYPPVKHEAPRRWGPYGKEETMLVPDEKSCPYCKGGPCRKLRCMELITPETVFNAAKKIISENPEEKKHSVS